jgi:hypothetical protein
MRLAIADPPYPPIRASHPRNDSSRARRWYGDPSYDQGSAMTKKAESDPDAEERARASRSAQEES